MIKCWAKNYGAYGISVVNALLKTIKIYWRLNAAKEIEYMSIMLDFHFLSDKHA